MTDTAGRNPPTMPPGRELDAAVTSALGLPPVLVLNGKSEPAYSTSWDAMRLVVERLVALRCTVNVTVSSNGATCSVHRTATPFVGRDGDTLPHAVCLAALDALRAVEATNA